MRCAILLRNPHTNDCLTCGQHLQKSGYYLQREPTWAVICADCTYHSPCNEGTSDLEWLQKGSILVYYEATVTEVRSSQIGIRYRDEEWNGLDDLEQSQQVINDNDTDTFVVATPTGDPAESGANPPRPDSDDDDEESKECAAREKRLETDIAYTSKKMIDGTTHTCF